ncbi:transglycosylase domain-containing protein [Allosalinactinospora lopnorensis]|uniref:transglycosylase domain-containing protein n=1 Tax=Allosalinactinospora lopnorensis TaxID=1352348 RepID=UPI000AE6D121|nr:transglycosylase domain-containing protein [Allosalinactinospora lopnorensis]
MLSRTWKAAAITFLICAGTAGATFAIAYLQTPDPGSLRPQASAELKGTSITYADGSEAVATGELRRIPVKRNRIPPTVVNGVLAAEHRNFYTEPGVSPVGLARAALSGGASGGGSTITQQMARNYYDVLSQERTYTRKFKEILIAIKVERSMPRDDILTTYLNTIYLGRQAYGVQASAQAYFGKDVDELDQAEGAFIGAVIQQPGNFENFAADPELEEVLRERWDYVVEGMVEMNEEDPDLGVPREEADRLEFPDVVDYDAEGQLDGYLGYIKTAVQRELRERYGLSDAEIAGGGYQVRTSLREDLMDAAEEAADEGLDDMPEQTRAGLTAVDPRTGEIVAFNGGANSLEETDPSLTERTQAGTSFKPYVLATALEQGRDINRLLSRDDGRAANAEVPRGLLRGDSETDDALFVSMTEDAGPEAVANTANFAGIAPEQFETAALEPSIALGTYQVSALDQASGFATFANGGEHRPAHMVTELTSDDGDVREPADAAQVRDGENVVSASTAADITLALTLLAGQARSLSTEPDPIAEHVVAGMPGSYTGDRAAWYVGYTPRYSVAVNLFRTDGGQLSERFFAPDVAGSTWTSFMAAALEGEEPQFFPQLDASGGQGPRPLPRAESNTASRATPPAGGRTE